ncbi:helix-turn-helix transcriptional regulator [Acidovorax sp. PRC11]|uniref:helix-turn-helix domain-containing protein n=1 Tax=Acidovorax sp. PRC11 TaxID=2962592 RepID=UPI002881A547|nr:helix-turn-helix transcriptional regulator [Acidovorax sp. PRC11]MDT0139098.1 helix-turn-helix transcriptional regulator [Acidovorax sp. PRC11]
MSSRKNANPQANFGRALQQLRAARGVTQEDMLFATSRRHISRVEQGHQVPGIRVIESLAENLQVHPLTLITAAYCPALDSASISELLKIVKAEFRTLSSGQAGHRDSKGSETF